MKVLMIHVAYRGLGGGEVQMKRLRQGLCRYDIQADVLCRWRGEEPVHVMPRWHRLEHWLGKVTQRIGLNDVHCVSSFRVRKNPLYTNADLVDFHCLHSGFFNYMALPGLTADKPAVFTFHDMWPLTGHCHTSLECQRWRTGCGRCPHLDTGPEVRRDATAWEWKLKRWTYQRSKFHIITPSKWLHDLTRESVLLQGFPLHHIPHGIDTDLYRALDKEECREALGVPKGRKVLLFAVERMDRPLKGARLLLQALQALPASLKRETVLLLLGGRGDTVARSVDIPVIDLGYVGNDRLKSICFSAADLFLHPTRADNFPLVLLESLACGTPIVSFAVGGVPELVRPGQTGFLARPDDGAHFTEGIVQLLEDEAGRQAMFQKCREVAVAEYSLDLYVQRYAEIYRLVANGGRGPA